MSNKVRLVVDYRELKVIKKLQDRNIKFEEKRKSISSSLKPIVFETGNLFLGDFEFYLDDEMVLLIERKSVADLANSIGDGRHKNQKLRLVKTNPNPFIRMKKVMYLIEGEVTDQVVIQSHSTKSKIYGAMVNTFLRDSISVFRSTSIKETVTLLIKLYRKIQEHAEMIKGNSDPSRTSQSQEQLDYSTMIKKERKANLTPTVCFLSQLSQIPKISESMAQVIYNKYPTMRDLILAYESIPLDQINENVIRENNENIEKDPNVTKGNNVNDEIANEMKKKTKKEKRRKKKILTSLEKREIMVRDLVYSISSGKERKVGPVASKNLYTYLFGVNSSS